MKATVLTVVLLSTPLMAQTSTNSPSVVAVGCVTRAMQSGSLTSAPGVPAATPETAPALANSQEPTGALVLEGAKAAGAGADPELKPMTYGLEGKTAELQPHVGHQMEVKGALRTTQVGASGAKTQLHHLQVVSFKMLGPCPKPSATQKGQEPQ